MARRRLTLVSLSAVSPDVPRAEHAPTLSLSPTAPIARVAAEAAGAAALRDLADSVARDPGQLGVRGALQHRPAGTGYKGTGATEASRSW